MRQFFCLLCDSIILKKHSIFCDFCYSKLSQVSIKKRMSHDVEHYYLFSWSEDKDFLCRKLAYSLKQKPSSHFLELSTLFEGFGRSHQLEGAKLICPPASKKGLNHAKGFSQALMKLFYASSVLEVGDAQKEAQKGKKSKNERFTRPLHFPKSVGNWLFVDDVFVTGATCYRIAEQMKTKPLMILTLFYKEKEIF